MLALGLALALSASAAQPDFASELERFVKELGSPPRRISEGLPPELPAEPWGDSGFVAFGHLEGTRPPIGLRIRFNGREANSRDLALAFRDEHAIRLPPGGRVRRVRAGTPEEAWEFPDGTRLLHRLALADEPGTLFEFRLIQRRPDGRWAFGTYLPTADGKLRLVQSQETGSYDVVLFGEATRIELTRLPPESCRRCHAAASPNRYPDAEFAGPCAFGPAHKDLLRGWSEAFRARFGYEPFE